MGVHQDGAGELTGSPVYGFLRPIQGWIGMDEALQQRLACRERDGEQSGDLPGSFRNREHAPLRGFHIMPEHGLQERLHSSTLETRISSRRQRFSDPDPPYDPLTL